MDIWSKDKIFTALKSKNTNFVSIFGRFVIDALKEVFKELKLLEKLGLFRIKTPTALPSITSKSTSSPSIFCPSFSFLTHFLHNNNVCQSPLITPAPKILPFTSSP